MLFIGLPGASNSIRNIEPEVLAASITTHSNLPMSISQLNVWDHILINDKLVALASRNKSDSPAGKAIDLQDFKAGLDLNLLTKTEQSEFTAFFG